MPPPPGFKFLPNDETVLKYLFKKANDSPLFSPHIFYDYDFYGGEELWKNKFVGEEKQLFFFSKLKKKKYVAFRGFVRSSANGTWIQSGKAKNIFYNGRIIGTKCRFKFEPKKDLSVRKKGFNSEEIWLMEEFRLAGMLLNKVKDWLIVVCRVQRKNRRRHQQHKNGDRKMEDQLTPLFSTLSLESNNEHTKDDRTMEDPLIPLFSTLNLESNNGFD